MSVTSTVERRDIQRSLSPPSSALFKSPAVVHLLASSQRSQPSFQSTCSSGAAPAGGAAGSGKAMVGPGNADERLLTVCGSAVFLI